MAATITNPYDIVVYGSTEAETSRYYQKKYRRRGRDVDLSTPCESDPRRGATCVWPKTWDGLCFYEGHKFEGPPLPIVLGEDSDTGHFAFSFAYVFCSKQCAFAHYMTRVNTEKGRRQNLAFQSFVRKILKEYEPFGPALPKELMKAYSPKKGIYATIHEWRKASKCGVVVVPASYPYVPVSMVYEETVIDDTPPEVEKTVFDTVQFKDPPVKTRTPAKDLVREASRNFEKNRTLTSEKYVASNAIEEAKSTKKATRKPRPKKPSTVVVRKSGKKKVPEPESSSSDEEDENEEEEEPPTKRSKGKEPASDSEPEPSDEEIEEAYESDSE